MHPKSGLVTTATILVVVVMAAASIAATNRAPQVTSSGPPIDDIFVTTSATDSGALLTRWTTPPGETARATSYTLLKFNLDTLTAGWASGDLIGAAQLKLYVLGTACGSGVGVTESVSLYGMPSSLVWSETSMPTAAATIAAAATATLLKSDADQGLVNPATPGYYRWTDQATFAAWLEGQRVNQTVTLMLKVNSSVQTDVDIYYEDNELTGKNANCGVTTDNPPGLSITSAPPTALTMSTFQPLILR